MKKILLYNPPGGLWLRGEARCEQDLDHATAYTATAPTSLCYLAAIFRGCGIIPKIVDCPMEGIGLGQFRRLVQEFAPGMAILNASVLNLVEDLKILHDIRSLSPDIVNVVILPYFNSVPNENIEYGLFKDIDIIVIGEMEAVAYDLSDYATGKIAVGEIRGVIINDRLRGKLIRNAPISPVADLDSLPFPARDLIRNDLYLRPDVGRPMAAIVDGKGCPSSCIFCLAPITTGKQVRKRSADSVIAEIQECVACYGIRDFLFRSDTFTINKNWVLEFCRKVAEHGVDISWAANSKTCPFDLETATAMKHAGCFLVEFGIESGSDTTLELLKKGTTTKDALEAVSVAKEAGLLTYGTILIGFPWEGRDEIRETETFVLGLGLDFIEIHIVAPYLGTELYDMMFNAGLIEGDTIGHDMIRNPAVKGTRYLTREELLAFRRKFLKEFYLNPAYILRTLKRMSSWSQVFQYASYGWRLVKNLIIFGFSVNFSHSRGKVMNKKRREC